MSAPATAKKPCPICGRPAQARYKPFCSSRCADVDLHRWLSEGYRVPARAETRDEEEGTPDDAGEGEGADRG